MKDPPPTPPQGRGVVTTDNEYKSFNKILNPHYYILPPLVGGQGEGSSFYL